MGCEGDILFLQPKTAGRWTSRSWSSVVGLLRRVTSGLCAGFRDEFFLAPEYQEHGIVTEKVSFSYSIPSIPTIPTIPTFTIGILSSRPFSVASGLCLRRCCYSLGYSQVQFVTPSETGSSPQAEKASPGDGEEDGHREAEHRRG